MGARVHSCMHVNYNYAHVYFMAMAFLYIVHCSLPPELCNGAIVGYGRLNKTVLEGTVLTYQCDNGRELTGPNTITCTNDGVWSTEPEAIMCVSPTEGEEIC